jgi:streptogramin lyase
MLLQLFFVPLVVALVLFPFVFAGGSGVRTRALHGLWRILGAVLAAGSVGAAGAQSAYFSGVVAGTFTQVPTSSGTAPFGIAVDDAGNVYVADQRQGRLLKETPMAGGGYTESVISGLPSPRLMAFDDSGNLYVADYGLDLVVKETPSGGGYSQTTVAAFPDTQRATGLAVDGNGNVYFAIPWTGNTVGQVFKETPSGGGYVQSQIPIVGDSYASPAELAVDASGNVYVIDQSANWLLKETPSGTGYTQSFVPTGSGYPTAVAVDGAGDLYVATEGNQYAGEGQIVKDIPAGTGWSQAVIGTSLGVIYGLAVDANGNVYLASLNDWWVGKVVPGPPGTNDLTNVIGCVRDRDWPVRTDSDLRTGHLYGCSDCGRQPAGGESGCRV